MLTSLAMCSHRASQKSDGSMIINRTNRNSYSLPATPRINKGDPDGSCGQCFSSIFHTPREFLWRTNCFDPPLNPGPSRRNLGADRSVPIQNNRLRYHFHSKQRKNQQLKERLYYDFDLEVRGGVTTILTAVCCAGNSSSSR